MQALKGLKVVDMTRVLAGPWCTQIFADYGADVIKIEKPGSGDDSRSWGPPFLRLDGNQQVAAYFAAANRGKRSVALDFSCEQDRRKIVELVCGADVFVENFIPGTLGKYGLDHESLSRQNPGLIYCSISGYGQSGPYARRPGYDAVIQGVGGIMSVTGEKAGKPGGGPQKVGLPIVDLMTGQYAAIGILLALAERTRSGCGQRIDLSLLDVQVSALAPLAASFFATGIVPGQMGNQHATIAPSDVYECADGPVQVTIGNNPQFQKFAACIGVPDIAADPRFASVKARSDNRSALDGIVRRALRTHHRAAVVQSLSDAGIPCGPINDLAQVFDDPQVRHSHMVISFPAAGQKEEFRVVRNPLNLSRTPATYGRPPPMLGEHGLEILGNT